MFPAVALAVLLADGVRLAPRQTDVPATSAARTADVLTIADAVAQARSRSSLVAAARERQQAAVRARQFVAGAANPLLELRGENYGAGKAARQPRDVFATLSQPVELGGKRQARTAAAEAVSTLAATETATEEWAASLEAAELYVDALRARESLVLLAEQRQGVAQTVSFLAERLREGVAAEADLRRFETERTRLASQEARTSLAMQTALLRLSALLGREVSAGQLDMPEIAAAGAQTGPPVEAAIALRPDVQAAAARLQRAEATAALERARGVPDLTVTAGYKRTSGLNTGIVGISLPIALFDRNRVAIAHAAGDISAARLDLEYVRQQARADAEARWRTAQTLAAQAALVDTTLIAPAEIVRTAARASFLEGRGDVLQLVDAERVYGEAAREALELRLDAILSSIGARLAAGAPLHP